MKKIYTLLLIIFFTSCASVEKYNAQISKLHSPKELKEDVDFTYAKLQKLHPSLYRYISKEKLDANFSNLKQSLTKPLSSIDFYKQITPIVTSIKQGHTSVRPPFKLQTKFQKKTKGKREFPFDLLDFTQIDHGVFLAHNYSKDSTLIKGSELLAINNETVPSLLENFKNLHTGDGFNKTFIPAYTRKYIGYFYAKTHGLKDSLLLNLKIKDSVYNKYIHAFSKKLNTKKETTVKTKKLSKAEKKLEKKKRKQKEEWKDVHGYDKLTKTLTRSLKFLKNDTLNNIAYLKIRGFEKGNYEDFYKGAFKKIDSAKTTNLIIDLRDNRGGRIDEIANLYAYLVHKKYTFAKPAKMNNASNWLYNIFRNKSIFGKTINLIMFPYYKYLQIRRVKYINGEPYYYDNAKEKDFNKEYNYKGKIYVLINGISFSASSVLSSNLKINHRAYFVGEETGGANNTTVAGQFANFALPNSKVKLSFGLLEIGTYYIEKPDGFGVKPDKIIKNTSVFKDNQLNWILNNIK